MDSIERQRMIDLIGLCGDPTCTFCNNIREGKPNMKCPDCGKDLSKCECYDDIED